MSAKRPGQMPGMRETRWYPWNYHEGLRMDEAMNALALVATGIYGKPLLKQHGAPVRIVVPWNYPKAIVEIELVSREPRTFWQIQPHEYGFLSNVNPFIPHPRWSQAESYWLGDEERLTSDFREIASNSLDPGLRISWRSVIVSGSLPPRLECRTT